MLTKYLFRPLLLVYQMPKTGSQTVEATLQRCGLPHCVLRFHYLGSEFSALVQDSMRSEKTSDSWKLGAARQLEAAARLSRLIRCRNLLRSCGIPVPKLEVITAVREVISLALASIFENAALFAPGGGQLTTEICREALLRPRMFTGIDNWFDWELKKSLGIDVYRTAFPRHKGYTIYENHHARVLLYRMEAIEQLPRALHVFLGCPLPEMANRNLGRGKPYASQYSSVREHLRLPPTFVAERYETQLMRHFYTNQERKALTSRWSEAPCAGEANPRAHPSARGFRAEAVR
jgi:hypothetical protein